MASEAREELFDYFEEETISDNLAHQPEEEAEPQSKAEEAVEPIRVPLWKRAVMIGGALVIAGGLLTVAMSYSDLYTARQELAQAQARLEAQQQNTTMLSEEISQDITLSDLYSYATGTLGMREASGSEITRLGELDTTYTVQTLQDAERKPTQVKIHLFGGNN